jgi:phosphoglycerate dehydrogenase-like enzyme
MAVTRVVVDQDIRPTERLTGQLPEDWSVSVGIEGSTAGAEAALADADVALVTSRIPVSRAVLEAAPDLDVVGKIGTGIDNVDLGAAEERGVAVTYTPGHNALSVAEHTLGLLLSTARNLTESRRLLESGRWRDESTLGTQLSGKTIGIVGFGNVGRRVGRLLAGFDVELLVHDPYVASIDPEVVGGQLTSFDDLIERSDAVTVNAELTAETRELFDAGVFDRMKDSAFLVNTARGPIVDQGALVAALRSGDIAGAGLDVFETEPLDADAALLEFDTVVVSPHVAGMTAEARASTIDRLAENVRAIVEGRDVPERYLATPG